jgi:L-aminopeptidase/D-esterase-like protein
MNYSGSITDVAGITVGHHTDLENGTGCTVILCDEPANAGMEVRGAAPGSRETALLDPLASAQWVNAITLTGGSAFGLDSPGGVVDPMTGEIVAGPQTIDGFADSIELMIESPPKDRGFFRNTTIGVVVTDAPLDKIGATRLAIAGQDGIALAIRPSHTANDGDTMFGLSTGTHPESIPGDVLHAAALKAVTGAIMNAIDSAETLGGVMSAADAKSAHQKKTGK